MAVGILKVYIKIDCVSSLKEKRSVLQPFIKSIQNNYNVSVSELDGFQDPGTATLGIAHISDSGRSTDSKLSKLLKEAEKDKGFRVSDYSLEII